MKGMIPQNLMMSSNTTSVGAIIVNTWHIYFFFPFLNFVSCVPTIVSVAGCFYIPFIFVVSLFAAVELTVQVSPRPMLVI